MKQLVIASSLVAVGLVQVPGQGQDQDLHQPVPLTAIECEIVDEVLPGELDPDLWAARLSSRRVRSSCAIRRSASLRNEPTCSALLRPDS